MANIAKKTFTAKVTVPTSTQPRYIPNCILYKNKLVSLVEIGVGKAESKAARNEYGDFDEWEEYSSYTTKMKPYFNSILLGDQKDKIKKMLEESKSLLTKGNEEILLKYCFEMGQNEGGYIVEDVEEAKRKEANEFEKLISERAVPLTVCSSYLGYFIVERLPKEIWAEIAPFGKYWSAADIDDWNEDMDDFSKVGDGKYDKGWYYDEKIIEKLKSLGFKINEK